MLQNIKKETPERVPFFHWAHERIKRQKPEVCDPAAT